MHVYLLLIILLIIYLIHHYSCVNAKRHAEYFGNKEEPEIESMFPETNRPVEPHSYNYRVNGIHKKLTHGSYGDVDVVLYSDEDHNNEHLWRVHNSTAIYVPNSRQYTIKN